MVNNSQFQQHLDQTDSSSNILAEGELSALSHYPSLGKLFENNSASALFSLKSKLNDTFQSLERVVLRSSNEDAAKAKIAALAVKNTLDFLDLLDNTMTERNSK